MTSEINPVLLQAQNIDLKQRLEAAEKRISELRATASQSTIHMINSPHDHAKLSAELESLKKASSHSPGSSPSAAEAAKLQQQIESLKKQLEEEQEKTTGLEVELEWMKDQQQQLCTAGSNNSAASGNFSRESTVPPPPPSSAPPDSALQAMVDQERERRESLEKDLGGLRSKLASSNAEAFKWKNTAGKLEKEVDALRKSAAATPVVSTPEHDPSHVEMIKKLNEELHEQLKNMKQKSEDSDAEAKRMKAAMEHLQQELKIAKVASAAAASSNEAVATLQAEIVKLNGDVADEKLDNESLMNEISSLRAAMAKVEEERAVEKKKAAEAEFDRLLEGSDAEGQLRKQLRECQEERDKAQAAAEKAQAEHLIMLRLKDKTLLQLNQTSEELMKAREHFQKREEDLLKQLQDGRISPKTPTAPSTPPPAAAAATSSSSTASPSNESFSSPNVLQGAVKNQEALQQNRDANAREQRKKELLAKLKAKTREDQANAEEIFTRTAKAYDTLLKQLREAYRDDSGRGQEEVYYDVLWDYERKLYNLTNDYQSMRTIIDIKQTDMDSEMKRLREADETKLAILRMQLQDLGKTPQC